MYIDYGFETCDVFGFLPYQVGKGNAAFVKLGSFDRFDGGTYVALGQRAGPLTFFIKPQVHSLPDNVSSSQTLYFHNFLQFVLSFNKPLALSNDSILG